MNDAPPAIQRAQIRKGNSVGETFIAEQVYIRELSNSLFDPALSVAQARVAPGITTRWHRLIDTSERYYILEGLGEVEVGELPSQPVGPGDLVLIPPMCRQRIHNPGTEDLVFLAICTPRFRPDAYQDCE